MLDKLVTALRGAGHEAGQRAVDSQAFRILEQELRDAERAVADAKRDLVEVIAQELAERRRRDNLDRQLAEWEAHVRAALGRDDAARARRGAERIAVLERQRAGSDEHLSRLAGYAMRIRDASEEQTCRIAELKGELALVRSTEATQRAEGRARAGAMRGNTGLAAAEITLSRIRELQQQREDVSQAMLIAAQLPEDASDDAPLCDDGGEVERILARLRDNREGEPPC